ncbi:MAG: putative sugar O-methyltransferase, partial [Chitinophagia bacterium]|nr:putative sugar O-methyltransferase [Chitinophagia bacterium]
MPKLGKIRDLLTIYGIFGVLEEVSDRRKCWTLSSKLLNQNVSKTSISDATPYVMVCELANSDKEIFTNFRRCLEYRLVLEHVNRRFGKKYLQLASGNPNWRSYLGKINTQNRIGNPILKNFNGIGKTSPTSLRYLKVLTDLETLFGNLNGMNIAEIGAGFGGQAHAISSNFEIAKYSIFDLPEVNRLIKRFLASLINIDNFVFVDGRGDLSPNLKYDLVISNYAFSELNRETQEKYLN